jgi:tetratricopeptide (TPR) repeat protein
MAATRRSVRTAPAARPVDRPLSRRIGGRQWPTSLAVVALVAAGCWAYATSFDGVFVLDDHPAIVHNSHIRTLWPLSTAMSAPPEAPVSGRPVASLTLAINYALAPEEVRDVLTPDGPGASPGSRERFLRNVRGYHAFNLALHLLAALAMFGVVRRTLQSDRLRSSLGDHASPLAFAAALIWLVHPLLTDAVTYVVQRTEVLMGLWYVLTLYCAIRAGAPGVTKGARRWWTAGSVGACLLGMGSKQTMVVAPVMIWLWDWMFASNPSGEPGESAHAGGRVAARGRMPLYAGLAATWALLAVLVAQERWPTSVGPGIDGWTPWTYLLTQAGVVVHYLRLAAVASPLVLDYDGWPMARSMADVAPQALAVTSLLVLTLLAVVRRWPWGFAGAWIFAALAPSSSLLPLPTEIAAERRMYLPLAGLVSLVVVVGYLVGRGLLRWLVVEPRRRKIAGGVAAAVAVGGLAAALGGQTADRNRDFWSEERIWRDAVDKRPDNPRARLNYGVILTTARRFEEAEAQLREAIRLKDGSAQTHATLGSVLCSFGRVDEGVSHLERALAIDPAYHPAYGSLAEAYGALGRRPQAARYFALAVAAAPDTPFLMSRLGWLLATAPEDAVRDGARAVALSERAVRLTFRGNVMALTTLAAAYAEAGRFDEAAATARDGLALAERQGNQAAASALASHLSRFEARRPIRDPE